MYIIALRILKSNKYIHFYLKNNMFGKNGGHVEKMAAILDCQVANWADLTSSID